MKITKLDIQPDILLNSLHNLDLSLTLAAKGFSNAYNLHSEIGNDFHVSKIVLLDPIDQIDTNLADSLKQISHQQKSHPNTHSFTKAGNNDRPTQQNSEAFYSGWAGLINYPEHPALPQCEFYYYDFSILIDDNKDYCVIVSYEDIGDARKEKLKAIIRKASQATLYLPIKRHWQAHWDKKTYTQAFTQVKDYLLAGDCYQINLTMPFKCTDDLTQASPIPLMERFNAPFFCHMKGKHKTIFSVTPERFIKVKNGKIETRPIKGTIQRGATSAEDQHNIHQLKSSEKDQAENLMIVDLLRNDLSKSAQPNSVKVEKLFNLETHANVHHLVSTITAQLKEDYSPFQAITEAFPGGSITGAPKNRAMEIISELEVMPRDAYCGSIGLIDDRGYCDFNILIRTIIAREEGAICWGGGGVVMDSTADGEYEEIFSKVQMILDTPL